MIQVRVVPHVERTMVSLLLLALSMTGLAGCKGPDDSQGPAVALAVAPGSITLTYICGNSFRVRNTNASAVTVTWDVYKTTEKGTLALPPKPATGPYSETYFTTVNKGTVRLFESGALIQTKANGNKLPCTLPGSAERPPLPSEFVPPATPVLSVSDPTLPEAIYYRDYVGIRFDDSTGGARVREILSRYQATVVGGAPASGEYFVQVPDPGPTYANLDALIEQISAEEGVEYAAPVSFSSGFRAKGRYPNDGNGSARIDWMVSPTNVTRPRLAIRAQLAWGCETGAYGNVPPSLGVLDLTFDRTHPDFQGLSLHVVSPAPSQLKTNPTITAPSYSHGTAVAGAMAAVGNNATGVAGIVWRSDLTVIEMGSGQFFVKDASRFLSEQAFPAAIANGVRVLVNSTDYGSRNRGEVRRVVSALRRFLTAGSGSVFVMAAGETTTPLAPPRRGTLASVVLNDTTSLGLERAVATLYGTSLRSRILYAYGSDSTNQLAWFSDFYTDAAEIVAPATFVETLKAGGGTAAFSGTSVAAPLVAGVAGLLVAMQPTLSGDAIKDYLVRGAAELRGNATTGALDLPPLTGTTANLLDAYGAVTLLARDRNTSICGFPVVTAPIPATGETSVRLQRPGQSEQEVYRGYVNNVTVAQGGRIIGIDDYSYATNVSFQFGTWEKGTPRALEGYRQFLETDTAVVSFLADGSGNEAVSLVGPSGNRGPFTPCANPSLGGFFPAQVRRCHLGAITSSGAWVHTIAEGSNLDVTGCGDSRAGYGSYLVSLLSANSAPRILREVPYDPCSTTTVGTHTWPALDVLAWRADGAIAWVGQSNWTFAVTQAQPTPTDPYPFPQLSTIGTVTNFGQESVVPGVTSLAYRSVGGRIAEALGWKVDGSHLVSYEFNDPDRSVCERVIRAGLAPQEQVSSTPLPYCADTKLEPLPVNVRAASSRSGPALRGGGTERTVPEAELRLQAMRRRTVQRSVLVN